jgi:hypothetical protein
MSETDNIWVYLDIDKEGEKVFVMLSKVFILFFCHQSFVKEKCGKSILQRKTQFNVRHLQTQQCSTNIIWPPPPPLNNRTGRQYKPSYQVLLLCGASPIHLVTWTQKFLWDHMTTTIRNSTQSLFERLSLCGILCNARFLKHSLCGVLQYLTFRVGSYHFCRTVNIFDQIEINLWNTSYALSLQKRRFKGEKICK